MIVMQLPLAFRGYLCMSLQW